MNKLTEILKNKPILSSIILILLTNEITDFPLKDYLCNFIPYEAALMISISILQMGCFGFLLCLSYKLGIAKQFNLNLSQPVKSLWLIIPFFLLIIANIADDMNSSYPAVNSLILVLYSFAFLSTGFFEEILFRGIIFTLINNKLSSRKHGFYLSLFISSFLFGAAHITNFLKGTVPFSNFINQLIYAAVIGVLFTALYLRCNTLWFPIVIHGLIDVTGCTEYLLITSKELYFQSLVQSAITYDKIISTLLLFIPFLIWALFLLRKSKISTSTVLN